MKRTLLAGAAVLVLAGAGATVKAMNGTQYNVPVKSDAQVQTAPVVQPTTATPAQAIPSPTTATPVTVDPAPTTAAPPTPAAPLVNKQGIGYDNSTTFTAPAGWTANYTYRGCGTKGILLIVNGADSHSGDVDSGSGSFTGNAGDVSIRIVAPPACVWSLIVQ